MNQEILNAIYVHIASTIIYLSLIIYSFYKIKTDDEYKREFCRDYFGNYQKPTVKQFVLQIALAFTPVINLVVVMIVLLVNLLKFIANTTFYKNFIDLMNKEI